MIASISLRSKTGRVHRDRHRCLGAFGLAATMVFTIFAVAVRAETHPDFDPFESTTEPADTADDSAVFSVRLAESPDIAQFYDPFLAQPSVYDPFEMSPGLATVAPTAPSHPSQTAAGSPEIVLLQMQSDAAPINIAPANPTASDDPVIEGIEEEAAISDIDPCGALARKQMSELGINIMLPAGLLPKDHAGLCWQTINSTGGPLSATRCWPTTAYYWDATCLCHRPLYFEETNLERYGYGCCECIQPAVSAAHFFATVPALPYCMVEHCPGDCEYTLGHYRPGSCPPWRFHWPSCNKLAAATEAGVLTGMIFLIP